MSNQQINKPNIQIVTGTPFHTVCINCNSKVIAGNGYTVYADLNGKPFKAYYCEKCYQKRGNNEQPTS